MNEVLINLLGPLHILGLGTSGDDSASPGWLFAAIALGAVAFGASGVVARISARNAHKARDRHRQRSDEAKKNGPQ